MTLEAQNKPPATVGSHIVIESEDGLNVNGVVRSVIKIGVRWLISFVSGETVETDEDGGNGRRVYTERRPRSGRGR